MKTAPTQYPVNDLIRNRWSARSFSDKEVSKEDLLTMVEAGSWAFSASNIQPWAVLMARKGDLDFQRILNCLMPGNIPWAKNAAAFIVGIAKTKLERDGSFHKTAEHDLGAFDATLAIQATSMGIIVHPMAGFDPEKVIAEFKLAESLKPMVVMAVGYLDIPEKLEEPFLSRELTPRSRKPVQDFILNLG